ncbi:MAG: TIGR04211 family SH3 domain-containing protein [Deltaproteobacteria bacterium]|nr:MAG: TIGR04211 family SH3 domain-containing protein [Deltaproteobacteria bacterium]UCH07201.1 MAG: TIGR04211 family SH3 domain-containing protein [Deltaproteobacteria bacterium]
MSKMRFILGLIPVLFMVAQSSWAATVYVSDSFQITLRTGPSTENKIIAMPSSGQPLEVLDAQGDWTQVRMHKPDGDTVEGWVLTRYLSARLPWEVQAETLNAENASLKEKLAYAEMQLKEATVREQGLARKLKENTEALKDVRAEYDSLRNRAADYLKLEAAYEVNLSKLETAEADVHRLAEEVKQLRSSKRNRWFLTGALVLFSGLIIGLVLGRQRRRRSSYY